MIKMKIMLSSLFLLLFITVNAQDNPQGNQQSGNTKYETHYKQTADDLAQNLKARIDLDDSQTSKVSDILAEYNRRVWGIKYHLTPGSPNVTMNDSSETQKQAGARGQNDMSDSSNYYAGLGRMEIENLRDADRTADQDIVNVLNTDQKQKYVDVKLDWWSVVKDRVYNNTYKDNMKENTKQNEDMYHNSDSTNPNKDNWK